MQVTGIEIIKRLSTFILSIGAVLFTVFATQPAAPSNEVQNITAPDKAAPEQTIQKALPSPAVSISDNITVSKEQTQYIVKPGDTLSEIALKYGVSIELIKEANGLTNDNIVVGQKLMLSSSEKLKQAVVVKTSPSKTPVPSRSRAAVSARVGELINWSRVQDIFAIGETAALIDVDTGETFNIKRKGGHNHADCEPLSSADTAIMKKVYGSWSWNRRAVVLVTGNQKIAASMAGMPHGTETVGTNNFSGHFDLHFLGSMTHGSSYTKSGVPTVDPDHQAMVRKAAGR